MPDTTGPGTPAGPPVSLPPGLLRALSDPGSLLSRQALHEDWDGSAVLESLPHWQARAVLAAGYHYCGCDGFGAPAAAVPGRGAADGDDTP